MPEARSRGGTAVVGSGDLFYFIADNLGGHGEVAVSVLCHHFVRIPIKWGISTI